RPVVDVLLHALRHLIAVDLPGDTRAGAALDREVALHVAAGLADLPELAHVRVKPAGRAGADVGPVVLVSIAADGRPARDLQRHAAPDAVEIGLVGVRVARDRPGAHADP